MTAQHKPEHFISPQTDSHDKRNNAVKRVILLEGTANLLVLLAKLWVGLSSGSLAIIGDAIHSLSDMVNNIVALIVIRFSTQPADKEHPYGHHKFETLAVFGLASFLTVMAFELALSAFRATEHQVAASGIELVVMLSVLFINILVASWQRRWASKLNSDILHADASHTFADVMVTLGVIVGWQLSAMGYFWLDRVAALFVSGLVFYLAFDLFKRAAPTLVDEFAVDPEAVSKLALKENGVIRVKQVRSRWIGSQRAVDMVITVNKSMTTEQAHNITENIERSLIEQFEVDDISIHVEPEHS